MRSQDVDKINTEYLKIAQKLETAGAEAVVICTNTPHMTRLCAAKNRYSYSTYSRSNW